MSLSWFYWFIIAVLFCAPLVIPAAALRQLSKEIDQNEKFPMPDQHQVYWHIRHNREDIKSIYLMIVVGFSIIIVLLVLIAAKLHVFD
jgi:hypothetical protein